MQITKSLLPLVLITHALGLTISFASEKRNTQLGGRAAAPDYETTLAHELAALANEHAPIDGDQSAGVDFDFVKAKRHHRHHGDEGTPKGSGGGAPPPNGGTPPSNEVFPEAVPVKRHHHHNYGTPDDDGGAQPPKGGAKPSKVFPEIVPVKRHHRNKQPNEGPGAPPNALEPIASPYPPSPGLGGAVGGGGGGIAGEPGNAHN